jgi:amino acid permease
MADDLSFLSREELLGGLPARRASTLLFAIESRTARLVARSRQAMTTYLTEKTAQEQERAFLEAVSEGRDLHLKPTIQDLERYAPQWAPLVPDDPRLRAAVARLFGQEYEFTHQTVPNIRTALGLDDAPTRGAYERLYHEPMEALFAARLKLGERLRWLRSGLAQRLETMSPFWTAFSLTLTEMVGAGILAIPIAMAGVGPLAGIVQLLVLGLVNVLTIAANVEAITRNGNMRYGNTYFGRLIGDYLGRPGTIALTVALLVLNLLTLLAFYIGVGTTLEDATRIPAVVWAFLLFLVGLYLLRRQSLDATIATALLVGVVNICLIVILSLLTLPHVRLANLQHVSLPFSGGPHFDASILTLIFGVVLMAYFGHTSAGNAAKIVLRRDPSGRALMWGNIAALLAAAALYCLWVLVVNGAIAPETLAGTSGTALTPLADVLGPIVFVLGSVFVILSMGMGSIHISLSLANQVREWLPTGPRAASVSLQPVPGLVERIQQIALSPPGRFWLGMAPSVLIVLVIEWLFLTDRESFTEPISFAGVIVIPLLAGVFPMLMLAASRRKGEYVPGLVFRFLGHPLVIICVCLLFLVSILVHGLVIWEDPVPRGAAFLVSAAILVITFLIIRRGAFSPRTNVELRVDETADGHAEFNITSEGKGLSARVHLDYPDGEQRIEAAAGSVPHFSTLRQASFRLHAGKVGEHAVWAHRITSEGDSEKLPGQLVVDYGGGRQEFDLEQCDAQVVLPLPSEAGPLEIELRRLNRGRR